jgi:tetraacyldisaccharide-1-P 4'-kinase
LKTAVISRGYGATADNPLGDEPLEIKQAVPEVNLYIGSNRVKSIKAAEADHHDLILFDDGFQNLKFKPKTTVLAVTDRSRSEVVYRDFDFESKHADLLLGTKGVQFRENFLNQTNKFIQIDWQLECSIEQPVWLYCGIADPSELVSFYRDRGLQIRKIITVGDHDALSEDAVKSLMTDAKKDGCVLAMTQKDKVKFPVLAGNLMVLTRSIRNQDWIDAVFKSTM